MSSSLQNQQVNQQRSQKQPKISEFVGLVAVGMVAVILVCSHTLTAAFVPESPGASIPIITTSSAQSKPQSFQLAYQESFGFFDDVPDDKWRMRKRIAQNRIAVHLPVAEPLLKPQSYYQNNWNPDFSCEFEDFIGPGGDGGKWICDPHRLRNKTNNDDHCIVYSIGSNGKFDFELKVQEELPQCEIHIFDFTDYSQSMRDAGVHRASFHAWGLKSHDGTMNAKAMKGARKAKGVMKSMQETVEELGHVGRSIDIFKIDCEGCEWNSYKDWFEESGIKGLRQILVETHNVPLNGTMEFFEYLHNKGYVMFHKEPNVQYGGGSCVEFSFLQLNTTFFTTAP